MKRRTLVLLPVLIGLAVVSLPAAGNFLAPDELRPGMVGVGRTVFEGTELEEFRVEILGVLRNVMGPRRNLILARLEGGPLAETGVIAGMSGSPVYVDGKLIGAVSYSLGSFSKEPIAGITPIEEMTEISGGLRRPATQRVRLAYPVSPEQYQAALRASFQQLRPFADRPAQVQSFGLPGAVGAQLGAMLRPIATPLVLGGFGAEMVDWVSGLFQPHGFVPVVSGGAGAGQATGDAALRPGDAVGVSLIRGDLDLAATGTVTYLDGDRVYAFGHPFYNLGPTAFPMTKAYIYALLPSLFSSSKIAGIGDVIGTIQQDRATTIAGTLDDGPPMIPVRVSLEAARGLKKDFSFEIVNDQLFTPLLTYLSVLNTLRSYEREYGAATLAVKGRAVVKGHGDIDFEDLFTGDSPSVGAATYIAAPLTSLLGNEFEPVEVESLDIAISSSEEPRTATLERVWLDVVEPRAGKTVPLKLLIRGYRGDEEIRTVPVAIPANAEGRLSILVSDGARLGQMEQRELRQTAEPQSISQMIRALNKARKNNRLYVKLLSSSAGAVVNGETLASLPPSVLAVFEGDQSGGNVHPLGNATIGEWEVPTGHAVSGSRLLTINLDSN